MEGAERGTRRVDEARRTRARRPNPPLSVRIIGYSFACKTTGTLIVERGGSNRVPADQWVQRETRSAAGSGVSPGDTVARLVH